MAEKITIQEIVELKVLGQSIVNLATQLEKKLSPVPGGAARKGRKSDKMVEQAIMNRKRFIAKNNNNV